MIGSHSIIAGIVVVPAHLSVFHDDIVILSFSVWIWIKLFISLVKIQIFLMDLSQRLLSNKTFVLNFLGMISSLSYSGKFHWIKSDVAIILVLPILNCKDIRLSEYFTCISLFSFDI
ncbi:MAG: hypothetical protein WCG25_08515 [bacterium]